MIAKLSLIVGSLLAIGGLAVLGMAAFRGLEEPPEGPTATQDTIATGTPLFSARRLPSWTTEPLARHELAAALDPIVATAPPDTCVQVGDGTNAWYSHNSAAPLVPASNMKLITAAAAVDILGEDTVLTTQFLGDSAISGGTVTGNLYMVGGGDPLLTSDGYQVNRTNYSLPETDLEAVADQLVESGLRTVTGSVVGDSSHYDGNQSVASWPSRYFGDGTVGPLSGLVVNDGWLIEPTTGEGVGGPVPDPAAHAASVLSTLLAQRGVVVAGPASSGQASASATLIHEVDSLPVRELTAQALSHSDNTSADLLLKEIGLVDRNDPSTAGGTAAVTEWATAQGYPLAGMTVVDGSGLSYDNRLSCDLIGAVLRGAGPEGAIEEGLAVPGEPGTLFQRFGDGDWASRLRAKTGSLNVVTALSGWLDTANGATLDFEMLINTGDRRPNGDDINLQQQVLTALLAHPKTPPIDEAGPLPLPS